MLLLRALISSAYLGKKLTLNSKRTSVIWSRMKIWARQLLIDLLPRLGLRTTYMTSFIQSQRCSTSSLPRLTKKLSRVKLALESWWTTSRKSISSIKWNFFAKSFWLLKPYCRRKGSILCKQIQSTNPCLETFILSEASIYLLLSFWTDWFSTERLSHHLMPLCILEKVNRTNLSGWSKVWTFKRTWSQWTAPLCRKWLTPRGEKMTWLIITVASSS